MTTNIAAAVHAGAEAVPDALTSTALLLRIRGEYAEMPGLTLTAPQAARLWNLSASQSQRVLSALVDSGFLVRDARGGYRRRGCPRCL